MGEVIFGRVLVAIFIVLAIYVVLSWPKTERGVDWFRALLACFGYELVYDCAWFRCSHRYDSIDASMTRPIHEKMSVAPPWVRLRRRRIAGDLKPYFMETKI